MKKFALLRALLPLMVGWAFGSGQERTVVRSDLTAPTSLSPSDPGRLANSRTGPLAVQDELQVGYAVFDLNQGRPSPTAAALFRLNNPAGTLVTEAGVEALAALASGRIFVQEDGPLSTGVAFANPSAQDLTIRLTLRDAAGVQVASTDLALASGNHRPRFVRELFPQIPDGFVGSMSFEVLGQDKIGAVSLRQSLNGSSEPLLTTLPVVDLNPSQQADDTAGTPGNPLVVPQVGAGQGLSTQLIVLSRSAGQQVSGRIRLFGSNGLPLALRLENGETSSDFGFQIPPNGVFFTELTQPPGLDLGVGYAIVDVQEGSAAGAAVFRFVDDAGTPISEAGVGASIDTARARLLVDNDGTRTGVAIASPGNGALNVTFRLLDLRGNLLNSTDRILPPQGHLSVFADELFEIADDFVGLLEIVSASPVVPISLKLTTNSRTQPILTTLPLADLTRPAGQEDLILPQIGVGDSAVGFFNTELIFISTDLEEISFGDLRFRASDGSGLETQALPALFGYGVGPGEGALLTFSLEIDLSEPQLGASLSQVIGPDGGSLSIENMAGDVITLEIPPNALSDPTNISMTALESPPAKPVGKSLFPGVLLQPDGLVLRDTAALRVDLQEAIVRPAQSLLAWASSPERLWPVSDQLLGENVIQGRIQHFSTYTAEELTPAEISETAARISKDSGDSAAFPDLDDASRDGILLLDRTQALLEFEQNKQLLGVESSADGLQEIGQLLADGLTNFLNAPVPQDPCGPYHRVLLTLQNAFFFNEADSDELINQFIDRVKEINVRCVEIDLSGTWIVNNGFAVEQCRSGGLSWTEEDEVGMLTFAIDHSQEEGSVAVNILDFPGTETLTGDVSKSGLENQPFALSASNKRALTGNNDTPDCRTFLNSSAQDLETGLPICAENENCTPLSCQEQLWIRGRTGMQGSQGEGRTTWFFKASVQKFLGDGPPTTVVFTCNGASDWTAFKQE